MIYDLGHILGAVCFFLFGCLYALIYYNYCKQEFKKDSLRQQEIVRLLCEINERLKNEN